MRHTKGPFEENRAGRQSTANWATGVSATYVNIDQSCNIVVLEACGIIVSAVCAVDSDVSHLARAAPGQRGRAAVAAVAAATARNQGQSDRRSTRPPVQTVMEEGGEWGGTEEREAHLGCTETK